MGKALSDSSSAAKEVFDRADAALDESLSSLCFEGPEDALQLTANTQPAILTASVATLEALQKAKPDLPAPAYAAGHSLGEYSALVATGALAFEDAVRLVRLRGQAMQSAVPEGEGGMLAVMGGTPEAVEQLCETARQDDVLSPANFNCPGQIVIAGHRRAVERAGAAAKSLKLKGIPLKVSAPFHCELMAPAAERVASALKHVEISPPTCPVLSNVDAQPNEDPARTGELLVKQICGAVQWEQTLRYLEGQGVTHALELGPGRVLAGLMKKTAPQIQVLSIGDPEALSKLDAFLG